MRYLIFSIFFAFTISSCSILTKAVLKITGYYKKPKFETSENIINYVKKQKATYTELYVFKSKLARTESKKLGLLQIPNVLLFDKNQNLIGYSNGEKKCPWLTANFVQNLNANTQYPIDTLNPHKLSEYLVNLVKIDSNYSTLQKPQNFDFYVIYTWAICIPKHSKGIIEESKTFVGNKNASINLISINNDLQKNW
jgi:hypothetical protein